MQSEQLSDMIKETVREAMQGVPALPPQTVPLSRKKQLETRKTIFRKIYSLLSFMTLGTIKEETDMAVLQKILSFIWGILLVVGKLLYLAAKLVLSLFLLVGQLVLVFFHAGGSDF